MSRQVRAANSSNATNMVANNQRIGKLFNGNHDLFENRDQNWSSLAETENELFSDIYKTFGVFEEKEEDRKAKMDQIDGCLIKFTKLVKLTRYTEKDTGAKISDFIQRKIRELPKENNPLEFDFPKFMEEVCWRCC